MKLNSTIKTILTMSNIDHFTAVEIRTAFIALRNDQKLDGATTRKFVYAELHKLVRRGWLNRITSDVKGITRFKKTNLFNSESLESILEVKDEPSLNTQQPPNVQRHFQKELNSYNVALLEGLGALETYLNLWQNQPEMKEVLKTKYMAVQENNHILKGKINAIEELLIMIKEKQI